MVESESSDAAGLAGAGRWLAIASELPCAVIAFLFIGQVVGESVSGPSGAVAGGILGVLLGLVFGTYSIYMSAQRLDMAERMKTPREYMPPMEEITREYDWGDFDPEDRRETGQ